jgi:hypothetical protein
MIAYEFHPASPHVGQFLKRCGIARLHGRNLCCIIKGNMGLQAAVSQAGYLLERSAGIWFSSWLLRYRAGWDYKLSGVAEATRWTIVLVGYVLGVSFPTPAARLTSGFVGLAFLCWPNFAYHLTNLYVEWPITEGYIVSIVDAVSRANLSYSYKHGMGSFSGMASLERSDLPAEPSPGHLIVISYDPLNPSKSKINVPPCIQAVPPDPR